MKQIAIGFLYAELSWSQTGSGNANTVGTCNTTVTGSNNQLTITCTGSGLNDKAAKNIVALLNAVLTKEPDKTILNAKLDAILDALRSSSPNVRDEAKNRKLRETLAGFLVTGKTLVDRCRSDAPGSNIAEDVRQLSARVESWLGSNLGPEYVAQFRSIPEPGISLMGMSVERSNLWYVLNQRGALINKFIDELK